MFYYLAQSDVWHKAAKQLSHCGPPNATASGATTSGCSTTAVTAVRAEMTPTALFHRVQAGSLSRLKE
jgi:hypothetical protein